MDLLQFAGGVVVVTGALIGIAQVTKPVRKKVRDVSRWLDEFQRDWFGEEEGLGRDPVPGVMERLNRLDGELSQNGGKSVKDTVNRLDVEVKDLKKDVKGVLTALDDIIEHLAVPRHVEDDENDRA